MSDREDVSEEVIKSWDLNNGKWKNMNVLHEENIPGGNKNAHKTHEAEKSWVHFRDVTICAAKGQETSHRGLQGMLGGVGKGQPWSYLTHNKEIIINTTRTFWMLFSRGVR